MPSPKLDECKCGGTPKFICAQVSEDSEQCLVTCLKCGAETDACEDTYCDFDTAAWMWNLGLAAVPL